MKWSFDQPLMIQLGPKPITVTKIKHGVTEANLSDGRAVRLTLHLDGVSLTEENKLDVSYTVISEIVDCQVRIEEIHETVQ